MKSTPVPADGPPAPLTAASDELTRLRALVARLRKLLVHAAEAVDIAFDYGIPGVAGDILAELSDELHAALTAPAGEADR